MKTDSFYSFYTKNLGQASDIGFSLFWNAQYQQCIDYYEGLIKYTGSIAKLGLSDALRYAHCCLVLGKDVIADFIPPPPPSRDEIIAIYDYENSQENLIRKNATGQFKSILTQPTTLNKAVLAAKIGIENNCNEAIETGTYLGESTYLFSGPFDSVETIEADKLLHLSASHWLYAKASNPVVCHLGNSGSALQAILQKKQSKQLIFLDAHYSTGITSNKYGVCPLIEELKIIFSSNVDCTIVIDDIRCMENPGYPNLREILQLIPEYKKVRIESDQLVII